MSLVSAKITTANQVAGGSAPAITAVQAVVVRAPSPTTVGLYGVLPPGVVTASASTGKTLPLVPVSGILPVFNILDFGASTSLADNASAINAAIVAANAAGGGIAFVPPVTTAGYKISNIQMLSKVWLRGAGIGSSLRSMNSNPNPYMISLSSATQSDCWISDLQLNGNHANQTLNGGINFDNTGQSGDRRHRLFNLYIQDCLNDGIRFTGAARSSFLYFIYINACKGNGVYMDANATDNNLFAVVAGNSGLAGFVDNAAQNFYNTCKAFLAGQVTPASGIGFNMIGQSAQMENITAQSCQSHGFNFTGYRQRGCGLLSDSNFGDAFRVDGASGGEWCEIDGQATDDAGPSNSHTNIVNLVNSPQQDTVKVRYRASALAGGGLPVAGSAASSDIDVRPFGIKVGRATPAYGATVTPNYFSGPWHTITVTNANAFTVAAPTNPPDSADSGELTIEVANSSGGAMGAITWNAAFKFAGFTWTNPANGLHRFARFEWNGTNWICTGLATADY